MRSRAVRLFGHRGLRDVWPVAPVLRPYVVPRVRWAKAACRRSLFHHHNSMYYQKTIHVGKAPIRPRYNRALSSRGDTVIKNIGAFGNILILKIFLKSNIQGAGLRACPFTSTVRLGKREDGRTRRSAPTDNEIKIGYSR